MEKENKHVLTVSNVTIRYKLGDFKDIGLKEWVVRHLIGNYQIQEFLAVDGVSFALDKGDMLGIVKINIPKKVTEEEKELLLKLKEHENFK